MTPQELGQREIKLLRLYCGCKFGMTPQEFYSKWCVTHAQIAQICSCSEPTVNRWFSQGSTRRSAEASHRRKLAEMDLIWEDYERIPSHLRQRLCPTRHNGKVPSP